MIKTFRWDIKNIEGNKLVGYYNYIFNRLKTSEYNFVYYPYIEYLVTYTLLVSFASTSIVSIITNTLVKLNSYVSCDKPKIMQTFDLTPLSGILDFLEHLSNMTIPEILLTAAIGLVPCILLICICCIVLITIISIIFNRLLFAVGVFIVSFFQKIPCFISSCSVHLADFFQEMKRVIANLPTFFTQPKTFLVNYFNALAFELADLRNAIQTGSPLVVKNNEMFLWPFKTAKAIIPKLFDNPHACVIALFGDICKFIGGIIDAILHPYSLGGIWFDLWWSDWHGINDFSSRYLTDEWCMSIDSFLDSVHHFMEFLLRDGPVYLCGLLVSAPACLADLLVSALECFARFYKPNLWINSHSAMWTNPHSAMWTNQHSAMLDHFATSHRALEKLQCTLPRPHSRMYLQQTRYIFVNPLVCKDPSILVNPNFLISPYVWADPYLGVFFDLNLLPAFIIWTGL